MSIYVLLFLAALFCFFAVLLIYRHKAAKFRKNYLKPIIEAWADEAGGVKHSFTFCECNACQERRELISVLDKVMMILDTWELECQTTKHS